jgi:NAD(P)-dependent dehydrogenase (short-subunit alcohol dehydrogenase family)
VNELYLAEAQKRKTRKGLRVTPARKLLALQFLERVGPSMPTQREQHDWLNLSGRVAVVTGAGSGIGAAIANGFATAGAKVAVVDRDGQAAANVATRLTAAGATALAFTCDVTCQDAVTAVAGEVTARLGASGILVNNAGILRPGPLQTVSIEDWNEVLAVNLTGYLIAAQAFGPHMIKTGSGSIVHIASIASTNTQPRSGAYSASKAGVLQLSKQLAVEWGLHGVRSNAILPGLIRTPLSAAFYENKEFEEKRKALVPTRRIGEPDDIAQAALFLASDRASYVNGAEILVDGGLNTMLMEMVPRPGY